MTIALCVPLGGAAGLWGPCALASAQLAVAELNAASGIAGRPCRLVTINAGDDARELESALTSLVDEGEIDALVGMHTSAVRYDLLKAVGGHIPFIYTPLYEGGERTPGVFAIGETTPRQLQPAIQWLTTQFRPKRWFFVGNDYVWPHATHRLAHRFVTEAGAQVVGDMYLPFGAGEYDGVLDAIRERRADAVLLSLIGQDTIDFNRAFGEAGLAQKAVRLSCALGENELLGIGARNTADLYVASGYFASLRTDANLAFKERYLGRFGARAPTLDTFGQSTYEGIHFLAALFDDAQRRRLSQDAGLAQLGIAPLSYRSARGAAYAGGRVNHMPIHLARAEGHRFEVIPRDQAA
ncbi:substrate-binding domain-containing protein [Paraburkholderia rhizosphaerae]|uniref:Amino acid/amide ABC transporter substrate-binding protein (HAAT family) n=1 Tax=Paraburkholderia rhizosphaerae TaxID=480658 RepID=A0A4R8M0V5_9BURK|nr:substrate-binding domain-containing protein [Paraburkholderia rhizosphaerae]TDY54949.1 amino acid/amide ABC transporter substrate-binding protein (HAAT family) [Paraburkholderia rhizosphaerae]